jgi:hypothetical protein
MPQRISKPITMSTPSDCCSSTRARPASDMSRTPFAPPEARIDCTVAMPRPLPWPFIAPISARRQGSVHVSCGVTRGLKSARAMLSFAGPSSGLPWISNETRGSASSGVPM